MTKSKTLGIGILAFVSPLALISCETHGSRRGSGLEIVDATGRYRSKVPGMLKEATMRVNRARATEGRNPIEFRGSAIHITEPRGDIDRASDMTIDDDLTIAGTAYKDGTAYIIPFIKRPSRESMVHELAHAVLLSNGIKGHPNDYGDEFKNWAE